MFLKTVTLFLLDEVLSSDRINLIKNYKLLTMLVRQPI